jgi:hypothetical protein
LTEAVVDERHTISLMRALLGLAILLAVACAAPFTNRSTRSSAEDENGDYTGVGHPDDAQATASGGCTLTQGYWKNHGGWPISPDTMLCGMSWQQTLETPPSGGNTFLILAHQYIAARLNIASGAAEPADVVTAMSEADQLMSDCTISSSEKDEATTIAGTLDDYNSGHIGPGHCDGGPPTPPSSGGEGEGSMSGEGEGSSCVGEFCPPSGGEGEGAAAGEGEGEGSTPTCTAEYCPPPSG